MRLPAKVSRGWKAALRASASLGALAGPAFAQNVAAMPDVAATTAGPDPVLIGLLAAVAVTVAALAWAFRVSAASRNASAFWTKKLAELEAQLEKSDAVLSAHPGLVLVWEDDYDSIQQGWGTPKILGGPAALASLMSFAKNLDDPSATPVTRLLNTLGDLPLQDDGPQEEFKKLRDLVQELRQHGLAFSGSIMTNEGRAIEADGRVAGGQVALWLTDPAVRMAEDGGILGKVREKTADLHGALAQLERAPIPAWRRLADLSLAWVNAAYVEAVEAPSAAIVLKDQIELDPAVRKIAERAGAERRAIEGRVTVNIKGARRALKITETPVHAAGDAGIAGFAVDITEYERAKADLDRHVEANRATLDQVPAAVAMFGAGQELVYYNSAFKRLFGLEDAMLANTRHGELLDRLRHLGRLPEQADFAQWKRRQLALYTEGMAAPGAERDGRAPDEIWNLPDARMLRVARARHPLGGALVVFDDITEKVALEARFNTQISVQRATLNNLSEGVAVFGADGKLRLYNTAFTKMWRFDEQTLAERPHLEAALTSMVERVTAGAESLASAKRRSTSMSPDDRTPSRDEVVSLSDGRTLAFGTEPLPDGATLFYFLDVTDSREREKELKARNELLEDIDRQKSKFVDHVSYQLRTPLATIIGFTEMLDGQMFGVLNDRQKDYIASILQASHHLRDLITDIIDLAAIDAGKMSVDLEDVDLRDLLTNAATYSALKAEDTQVSLSVACDADLGVFRADARKLKQILFNLLSNAFAFTGAGGSVTIGADRAPGLVRIWVADSGRGVSPGDQARVFEPFESAGPSAGAGLGLSLVQRLVSLHGGWVRMESTPGEGTRVTCYLPADPRRALTPPEPSGNIIVVRGDKAKTGAAAAPASDKKRPARRAPRAEAAE
ncbi:MAG: PAS-domain containing protein [Parvularculaceae bacterium]|nr:PAS-domain containing protein [Parvularculaceae bacterium]